MKLLVIDDREVVRAGVAAMLKLPIAGATSRDAVKAIDKGKPDVVLLGLNGFDTLEAIRGKHRNLPVVAFSSSDDKQVIARAVRMGVTDYVLKSANPKEL